VGVTNFDVVQANAFIGSQWLTQGNTFFVKPRTGNDAFNGKSPAKAFKTLVKALSVCTANQNDTVYLFSEGNTGANTTDYQAATLAWNKDMVHLIGVNSGPLYSQRARIAFASTYVTASNLFTLSANGCYIANIEFWAGVASALPTGCLSVTGQRNHFRNCHIAGMGDTHMDIAGAYSLQLSHAEECFFDDCTIGQDTSTCGAAVNSVILFGTQATRNYFRNCRIMLYTSHATNCVFLSAPAGSQDRYTTFEDCLFLNAIDSGSTLLTAALSVVANGGGVLLARGTSFRGATYVNTTDSGNVLAMGASPTHNTVGLAVAVTHA